MTISVFLFGITAPYANLAKAKVNNEFSKPFGLLVHNKNENSVMTRVKALEVLMKYFDGIEYEELNSVELGFEDINRNSVAYRYVERGCRLGLFSCSDEAFRPYEELHQRDFLDWFFALMYRDEPGYLADKYSNFKNEMIHSRLEAQRLNLLTGNEMTYKVVQEFLYRHKAIEGNNFLPYIEGLASEEDINPENYNNLGEIDVIINNLSDILFSFKRNEVLTDVEEAYLATVGKNYSAFLNLKTDLIAEPYVIKKYPDLDPVIRDAVREHNLQNVLYRHSYYYGKNKDYRQHNLKTGVVRFHGKVFMPDEEISYWDTIMEKGLSEFRYGWVIAQGIEQWQFGGGICGSSTMIFVPTWKSGLQVLERRNHSIYYPDLYPMEEIGLDATVYRPRPDLRILNTTKDPIVFNIMDDEENQILHVEIIGNKPYKNIEIEGPIWSGRNKVKWVRHIEDFNGKIRSEALESQYGRIN